MRNTDARRHARRDRTLRPKTNRRGRGNERRRADGRRALRPVVPGRRRRDFLAAASTSGTRGSGRAHAASAEGGGTAFVVHLTVRRDDDSDADADGDGDGSIDEKVDAISSSGFIGDSARASGCLFGTTRVSASRVAADGAAFECVAPARAPGLCFSPRARDTPRRREAAPTRVLRDARGGDVREPRPPPSSWSSPTSRASGSRSRDPPSPPPRDARGSISPRDPSSPRRRPGRFVWRVARGEAFDGRISPRSSPPTRTTP